MTPEQAAKNQSWGGQFYKFKAKSSSLGGLETAFNVFVPSEQGGPFPVLFYLAGLTCTEDTGAQKGGFLRDAAEHSLALVFPDTSHYWHIGYVPLYSFLAWWAYILGRTLLERVLT